jgi:hypothetical protein
MIEVTEEYRAEFTETLQKMLDQWNHCVEGQMRNGLTKEQAVEVVSEQATEWFESLRS